MSLILVVAAIESSNCVPLVIESTYAPYGIPLPVTAWPASMRVVSLQFTVVDPFKSQVSSVKN